MTETNQRVAPLKYGREEFSRPPRYIPILGKQERQPGMLLLRDAAPVDSHRHQQQLLRHPL